MDLTKDEKYYLEMTLNDKIEAVEYNIKYSNPAPIVKQFYVEQLEALKGIKNKLEGV